MEAGKQAVRTRRDLHAGGPLLKSLLVLFKVRVVMLLLVAAVGGAFLSAGRWPGTGNMVLMAVVGGLAASGASAINQYLERDLDARMERTRRRPLATAAWPRTRWVPYAGAALILLPVLAALPFKAALSAFVLLGAVIYIWVYTVWLKRRTPLNIVIGGLAGSAAVLSGSAAVEAWNDPGALVLAALVFLWTPTHFWSLALAYRDDYARGGFPMLPVRATPRAAASWILLHASGASLAALALAVLPVLGWIYAAPVALATVAYLALSIHLIFKPGKQQALALFHASNLYLALVMCMICVDIVVF
jgi:protoheme IX farnesyltransferase